METALALAAAQTISVRGDVDANVEHHLKATEAAVAAGARVIVFPELSLTGYEIDLAADLAFEVNDRRLEPLEATARAHDAILVVGAPLRLDGHLHIAALIVGPTGVDVYTKRTLGAFRASDNPGGAIPPPEASVFEPGTHDPLVDAGGTPAAIAVCADVGRPEHAGAAAQRGARIYLASMFVIPSELERDRARLTAYARAHGMVVVFANHGGPSGGLASAGSSAVIAETGVPVVELEPVGPGIAVAVNDPHGWRCEAVPL